MKELIRKQVYKTVASFLWTIGLTALIPIVLIITLPQTQYTPAFITTAITTGVILIVAVASMDQASKSSSEACRHLAILCLIPAGIAVFLYFYSIDFFITMVNAFMPGGISVEPLVNMYVEKKVPTVDTLVYGYVLIGSFFYWLSSKV
jgi:hypothetical protein